MDKFDLLIIGSGPGGYGAAVHAARYGQNVALVERAEIGGTCLNRGCISTKTLLASAIILQTVEQAADFGISVENIKINFSQVQERKKKIVQRLKKGVEQLLKSNGISLIKGEARFAKADMMEITDESGQKTSVEAKKIIIASGSVTKEIKDIAIDHNKIINSDDILELKNIPRSLLVVGGGVIGLEFACIFHHLGSKVTVMELLPRILPDEDEEISDQLKNHFIKDGIEIITDTTVTKEHLENYEKVLISVGRKPYLVNLGLEKIGIETQKGRIAVNEKMETSIPGIYAIGDVVGGSLLAHVASAEGIVAAENVAGKDSKINYGVIPNCIFTIPEIASVGLTEKKAKESGYKVNISRVPFLVNSKTVISGNRKGMIKILIDQKTDKIIGVHMIGAQVTELISQSALAMHLQATTRQIKRIIYPHPTLSEIMFETIYNVKKL